MNYRHFHYFVAVSDAGSFNRAATRLRISQPALSNRVKELEAAVGGPLFERRGRGIALTEAGKAFLPYARAAVEAVEGATSFLRSWNAAEEVVRIGVTPTLGVLMAPLLLSAAAAERLQIKLHQGSGKGLLGLLQEGTVDAALCFDKPNATGFMETPLFDLDLHLIGPAATLAGCGETVDFMRLGQYPLVLDGRENPSRRVVWEVEKSENTVLDVRAEVDPPNAKRATMISHVLSTIAPGPLYLDDIKSGLFKAVLIINPKITIRARVVVCKRHIHRIDRLCRMIIGAAAGLSNR